MEGEDRTSKYGKGGSLKFTNDGNTVYGIVTDVNFTGGDTEVTFLHEIDPATNQAKNLMANSAITDNSYTLPKVRPVDFPMNPNKWTFKFIVNTDISVGPLTQNRCFIRSPSELNIVL